MNTPPPVPAAVIGLGRIASLLEDDPLREKPCTHAGAITATTGLVLAAGADHDPARCAAFAARWGCPVFRDPEKMLRERHPQVVHIATHPDSHLFYAALAEKHGVPVVVCEKPLADTLAAARRIAAIHRRGRTRIIVNHERRYSANYRRMKTLIAGGSLGKPLSVKATLYMGRSRRLLDVLWHDGTHLIDAAAFLTGGTPHYKSRTNTLLRGKTGSAFFYGTLAVEGKRALPLAIEAGAGRDHLVFELDISLEMGRVRIGNGIYEVWESVESPYAQGFRALQRRSDGFTGPTGYFTNMAADALGCAQDGRKAPLSSAEDGLRVITFLSQIGEWRH
ncbi:MAG: Gfo/Idh/MocA family oxidoreductase [Spirochaetaceae bacterium]|jgi:predicted dehydrogenase|nr:Gfo/Idh/MocA family oxidoreductase [Spirochaetaceae bacterium]